MKLEKLKEMNSEVKVENNAFSLNYSVYEDFSDSGTHGTSKQALLKK